MASTYISRTPSSASNRRTWTWSAWVKRGKIGNGSGGNQILFEAMQSGGFVEKLQFTQDDYLEYDHDIAGTDYTVYTSRLFRDTNAWYHIMWVKDTTQATETDRIKLYVNGEQQTLAEHQLGYPGQNYEGAINNTYAHHIGANDGSSSEVFDGLMSHVHFCDGTALAPTVFGETDSTTGEWKIKTSPSFTPGTNGFTILKDGNTITDQSANSNDFSLSSGTLTKTEDNPSNVFCTLNPLSQDISGYASGNAGVIDTQNGNTFGNKVTHGAYLGTIGVSSGKYYWEVKVGDTNQLIGIVAMRPTGGVTYLYDDATANGYYPYGNDVYTNGSSASGGPYDNTSNKIYSFALDAGNNKLWVGRDGSFTGDPANGTGATWASLPTGHDWTPLMHSMATSQNNYAYFNFGNGYFGTTAVSSAGTNASGNGIFEYDVPTGYTALSTKGLNL
tara:strand:- start:358 stop:1692 length:1335 start_codon:yes stop_codon:yes gene_type:complete